MEFEIKISNLEKLCFWGFFYCMPEVMEKSWNFEKNVYRNFS